MGKDNACLPWSGTHYQHRIPSRCASSVDRPVARGPTNISWCMIHIYVLVKKTREETLLFVVVAVYGIISYVWYTQRQQQRSQDFLVCTWRSATYTLLNAFRCGYCCRCVCLHSIRSRSGQKQKKYSLLRHPINREPYSVLWYWLLLLLYRVCLPETTRILTAVLRHDENRRLDELPGVENRRYDSCCSCHE